MKRCLSIEAMVAVTLVFIGAVVGCQKDVSGKKTLKIDPAVVETSGGRVKGAIEGDILSFKGIPYAKPPVGDLRWRAPQAISWEGVRPATEYGNDCMQEPFPSDAAPLGAKPAEDCLVLNVWKKADDDIDEKLPVVVWIHGGGFVNGGSSPAVYDGSAFARKDVIFVSINYRLGRFGFFAHPALTAEKDGLLGNYGYMDQVAAMQWISENIAAFGGDPGAITIMGESAGGFSVINLMLAKQSRGLFQRAIIMSGGGRTRANADRGIDTAPEGQLTAEQVGINLANANGIEGTGPEALAALRTLSAEQVTDGLDLLDLFAPREGPETFVGGPLRDGEMITEDIGIRIARGDAAKVPVLIGTTSADLGFAGGNTKEELFASFGDYAGEARLAYDPNDDMSLRALQAAVGADRSMNEPAHFVARELTRRAQPVWLYRFSYVAESMRDQWSGAPHATDIPFFFDTVSAKYGDRLTDQDRRAAFLANEAFVNFIKTGNPNSPGSEDWPAYQGPRGPIMNFSNNATAEVVDDPWQERLSVITRIADEGLFPNLQGKKADAD